MPLGYKGQLLVVHLTTESSSILELPEALMKTFIGGRGLGAKLFWDLIPAGADPLGPENILMVLTGPVSGTAVPGSGKHVIITKSPVTGAWLEAYSSGLVSSQLKYAGYDGLLMTGRAARPLCLLIEDDRVTFQDAEHLWGKGAFEAERYLKTHFHPNCGTLVIGPAGENLLNISCIGSEYYRKAGRGGAGAVMGSKNLKAIAIRGTGGIACADIKGIYDLIVGHYANYKKNPVGMARRRYGTPLTLSITNEAGMLPTRNFTRGQFDRAVGRIDKDGVEAVTVGERACFGCFMSCSKKTRVKEGRFKGLHLEGPEYETLGMLGANLEVDDLPVIMKANVLCDDLGMDTISAGVVIGFAMECFERGILTESDTDGLKLTFGNDEAVLTLLERMAHKKGFGAFCAQGVRAMAEALGQGTEAFAMHSKGLEFPAYDPRAGWGAALTYAVTPRGGCHRRAWPPTREVLGGVFPFTTEGKAEMVIELMNENCAMHSLLVCDLGGKFVSITTEDYATYLNLVTGWTTKGRDLIESTEKIETLIRRINVREGLGADDDMAPRRILEEAHTEGPAKGQKIGTENFLRLRAEYYLLRGWDREGVPTEETIARYGLDEGPEIQVP